MKTRKSCIAVFCVVGMLQSSATWAVEAIQVDVTVSPSMIVLGLDKGASVTVHTDIALSVVDRDSVQLSGVTAYLTKADYRGNLVGKFAQADIEALVTPGVATLVLTGLTIDGVPFQGADTVNVMEEPSPSATPVSEWNPYLSVNRYQLQAPPPLSEAEIGHILFMREEEKLARDVYLEMYDLWGLRIFDNISQSEQRHMDAIGGLIDYYGLADPIVDDTPGVFVNTELADLYTQLIAQGSSSLVAALSAGALIEDIDIVDLRSALIDTAHSNVRQVFENLEAASCNHLRAFVGWLGSIDEVYVPQFLTQAEFDAIIEAQGSRGPGITRGPRQFRWGRPIQPVDVSGGRS